MLVVLPSWTSFLIRVYAWIGILKNNGLLNNLLMKIGIIDEPLQILYTPLAAYIGIVYCYLPFMVLPLYTNLVKHDHRLLEAAYDLGAKPWKAFFTITLPLSKAGIIAGCMLVMIPAVGEFVIPNCWRPGYVDDRSRAVGRVLQQPRLAGGLGGGHRHADPAADPDPDLQPRAAARAGREADMSRVGQRAVNWTVLGLGFAFLYVPVLILMVYSFNESRLATVWSGFSLKWYGELFRDKQMLQAAWISIKVAFWTATAAVVLGTMAALVMARMRRFPGKTLFGALITAPLVMPEVIIGLSILLMFVSLQGMTDGYFAPKGIVAIWIAHVTFTLAFVTVVVSSRLSELDKSLEEAAMDLGANRIKVFFLITLPIIAPALVSGWLLAFTLSLDDVVIASFVAGPNSTTLPMKVFSSVRMGLSPKINALATLMIMVVSVAAFLGWWLMYREEKRRQRDMQLALQENG
jgi:ABC-type spermidine/putrescine transport system, permease component II